MKNNKNPRSEGRGAPSVGDRVRGAGSDTVGEVVNTHPEKGVLVQWPPSAGEYVKPSWRRPNTLTSADRPAPEMSANEKVRKVAARMRSVVNRPASHPHKMFTLEHLIDDLFAATGGFDEPRSWSTHTEMSADEAIEWAAVKHVPVWSRDDLLHMAEPGARQPLCGRGIAFAASAGDEDAEEALWCDDCLTLAKRKAGES